MWVSSLTELHTPQQTLSFSIISKEQPLSKSVTVLNPVFQLILTVIWNHPLDSAAVLDPTTIFSPQ